MKNILSILSIFLTITIAAQKPNHDQWTTLLNKHVSTAGKVNYKELKKEVSKLDDYIEDLKKNVPESEWSSNEKKAYWVNAYNAFTVKLILTKYPLASIKDLNYDGKSAWDYKWIDIAGAKLSLNDIENKKLRSAFKDPRIHFVINCASYSCPVLINKAVKAENIDEILASQTKKFLADKTRNKISADKVQISELFKWYAEDFGEMLDFLNKYGPTKIKAGTAIEYLEYKWNINE